MTTGPADTIYSGELRFFGVFEMLHRMKLPLTQVMPVYSGYFAALYDALSGAYDWDLPAYNKLTATGAGRVLELGCGSGRLTIPLARDGQHVAGVDISGDMLTLLRRKLAAEPDAVARRVRLVQTDMRKIALDSEFDLILLPANNVSLLPTAEDRQVVFERAREHLAPGGWFAFDSAMLEPDRLLRQNQDLVAFPASSPSGEQFILTAHRYLPEEGVQIMNIYAESVNEQGVTRRYLGSWTKAVLPEAEVLALVAGAGMRVVETQVCDLDYDHRRMKIYLCKAA